MTGAGGDTGGGALAVREEEYTLVMLARAVLDPGGPQAGPLLRMEPRVNPTLSAGGLIALKSTLAKGLVRALAHGGGARREVWVPGGEPGRLWEQVPAPGLRVTSLSVELLLWLLREPLAVAQRPACPLRPATASGDVALVFLAARLLVRSRLPHVLGERIFRENRLVQLAFADALATVAAIAPESPAAPLNAAEVLEHALLVSGFSSWLAAGILAGDAPPAALRDALAVSALRRQTYTAWIAACRAAARWDLASPLADACIASLARPMPPALSDPAASARDRAAAARAGVVLAEVALTLGDHVASLGRLDFFDDGYADARSLRHRWADLDRRRNVAEGRVSAVAGV